MEIPQLQSPVTSLGLAPTQPLFDVPPPAAVPLPADGDPTSLPFPDLPTEDPLPEPLPPEPPVLLPPATPAPAVPRGTRSSRELPSLGGIPIGQLKALLKASQNAQLLAAAMGGSSAPPLQLSVSIQNLYVGDQQVATGTSLDIQG